MRTGLRCCIAALILLLINPAHAARTAINGFYAREDNSIFYFDMAIAGADADSFKILRFPFYAKDARRVYYHSFVIPKARPERFILLSESYSRDGRQVYFRGRPMELLFQGKFKVIDESKYLSADHRFVFFENKPLPHSDPDTFQILNRWFWKDRHQVYFIQSEQFPQILSEADAQSFVIDSIDSAHDKHRSYQVADLLKRAKPKKKS